VEDFELRPSFRPWLRRLDPALAAEDTNRFYQAFRRRRRYGRNPFKKLFGGRRAVTPAYILLTLLAVVVTLLLLYFCGCIALVVIPLIFAMVHAKTAGAAIDGSFLPRKLTHVFSPGGFARAAATDLHMAGLSGSEAAEAAYLESREYNLLVSSAALVLVMGIVLFTYVAVQFKEWAWQDSITAAMLLLTTVLLVPATYIAQGSAARVRAVETRVSMWRGEARLGRELGRGCLAFLVLFLLSTVGTLAVFGIVMLFDSLDRSSLGGNAVLTGLRDNLAYIVVNGIALAVMVAAVLYARLAPPRLKTKLAGSLAEADYAYQRFMATKAFEDPDGLAWALWHEWNATGRIPAPGWLPPVQSPVPGAAVAAPPPAPSASQAPLPDIPSAPPPDA
jgi:hypothetical protein